MGLFSDLFSTKPAEDAAQAKIAGLNTANTTSGDALSGGQAQADALYGAAHGAIGKATDAYGGLVASTGKGSEAYADATGVNGVDGLNRARAIYTADPGYSGGLTTGVDQVNRTAALRGDLGGGNTQTDLVKFASNYDNQKYSNYVSSLAPYLALHSSAVGGQAGTYGTDAGLDTSQGGVDLGVAGQKATNAWNTGTGIGNANADAKTAAYSASSNFWNALMGGAKLAVSAATGMPTGGGSNFSGPSYTQSVGSGPGSYQMPVY